MKTMKIIRVITKNGVLIGKTEVKGKLNFSLRELEGEKKTKPKVLKKGSLISIVLLCLLVGTVAYALLSNYTDIQHQLTIKGVKVNIWIWIDEVTAPTTEKKHSRLEQDGSK